MTKIPLGTTSGNWKTSGGSSIPLGTTSGYTGLQVTARPQQTAQVQQTAPTSYFQPAVNPQPQYGPSRATTTQTINAGPSPEEIARQQAAAAEAERIRQEEEKKTGLRSGIGGLIDQALGIYETLYGNIRGAAKSSKEALDKRQQTETTSLTDQFNAEVPKLGASYAARGLADSTYRTSAIHGAGQEFQNQLTDMSTQTEAEKAKIGAELMAQEAQLGTGQSLLNLTRSRLGEVTDLQELIDTQAEIQRKIAELQGQAQAGGTREGYLQRFSQIAPATDRMAGLQATLTNIINGQAPGPLKRAIAQQIIGSSGLTEEEKNNLNTQVTQQIG